MCENISTARDSGKGRKLLFDMTAGAILWRPFQNDEDGFSVFYEPLGNKGKYRLVSPPTVFSKE